ncbi:hypothetical protein [Ekhidna sp.]
MLIPSLTTAQRDGIITTTTPANSLIIFNTSQNAFNYYDGSNWIRLIPNTANFNIDMSFEGSNYKIINLNNGIDSGDAVNRGQLDTKITRENGSVINSYIADDAVTQTKIASRAVTTTKIADAAVNSTKVNTTIPTTVNAQLSDFNNLLTPGIFNVSSLMGNAPPGNFSGTLIVTQFRNFALQDVTTQIMIPLDSSSPRYSRRIFIHILDGTTTIQAWQ